MIRASVLLSCVLLPLGGVLAFSPATLTATAAACSTVAGDPVNKNCPIMGKEVDAETPTHESRTEARIINEVLWLLG